MRPIWALLAVMLAAFLPSVASAHPLGNFTVNHYARLEPKTDAVRIMYVLDMAEIPAFQEQPRMADKAAYASQRADEIRQNLHLTINGQPVDLHTESETLTLPPGAGGLSTLRLEAAYSAPVSWSADGENIEFRDDNDPTRIGWREIVARPGADGIRIGSSTASATDTSDELRQYPDNLLQSPLNERAAQLSVSLAAASASETATAAGQTIARLLPLGASTLDKTRSDFANLANVDQMTPTFVLFALGTAIVLGMAHALQPGHGKTVVAAYLVGARGTARHALFLGATVTATHTAGVYALGLVTIFLSQYIVPERLYPILEVASGALVLGIGAWLLGRRLLAAIRRAPATTHQHSHAAEPQHHDHSHDHAPEHSRDHAADEVHSHGGGPAHSHAMPARVTWRSLLALGVSGGLLPCPEALMVLLITIAAHRVLFGLLLIVAFSTGLAGVLVGFGLLLVYARGVFGRVTFPSSGLVPRLLPVASACVIVVAGGLITLQALPRVL
ncbi:MAG: hypothetical protein NVSMB2_03510 [Chloroflexota bacterium]